jgi:hypothetical protein
MVRAYTQIGSVSSMNSTGSLSSTGQRCDFMRRPASNCGQDRAATHRSRETGAGGPGTGIADAALQQVQKELASVVIGVQACIEVAVERQRN